MSNTLHHKLATMLDVVYPAIDTGFLADQLLATMGLAADTPAPSAHQNNWDEADVMLITYADTVQRKGEKPLQTLNQFLDDCLKDTVSAVHILPFFPTARTTAFP